MNFFKLEDRGILCMTFRETEMLLALLRSPDIPVHRSAEGTYLRSLLGDVVDPIRKSYSEGLTPADKALIQLMKSPEGLSFTMLKHLSGLSYGGSPNDLARAITELKDSGIVVAVDPPGPDGEEILRLKEGFVPDVKLSNASQSTEAAAPTPKIPREERTRNQIIELLEKCGGERSKTYIAKGLRLPFMDVDIALNDLVRDGKLLSRKRKKFIFYRLAGSTSSPQTKPEDAKPLATQADARKESLQRISAMFREKYPHGMRFSRFEELEKLLGVNSSRLWDWDKDIKAGLKYFHIPSENGIGYCYEGSLEHLVPDDIWNQGYDVDEPLPKR